MNIFYIPNRTDSLLNFQRNRAIFNELADRGHNLTVISPYHDKNAPSRVHYIPFENEFKTDIIKIVKECLNSTKSMSGFYENFLTIGTYSSVCLGKYKITICSGFIIASIFILSFSHFHRCTSFKWISNFAELPKWLQIWLDCQWFFDWLMSTSIFA